MISLEALVVDKQSFFSLLSPDLVHLMRLHLLAARVSGLGLCQYFLPHEAPRHFTPDILALAPLTNAVQPSDAMAVLRADPPVGALLRSPNDPKSWTVFTRRGILSTAGFRSWAELKKLFVDGIGGHFSIGNAYLFTSPPTTSWTEFAASYKAFMSAVTPSTQLFQLGDVAAWRNNTQSLVEQLAAQDNTPHWPRKLLTRLGRDIRSSSLLPPSFSIYPAVSEADLISTLLACNRPTDEGVILLKRYSRHTAEGLMPMLHILITEVELVWASREATYDAWEVHSITFSDFAAARFQSVQVITGLPREIRFHVAGKTQPIVISTRHTDDPTSYEAIVLRASLECIKWEDWLVKAQSEQEHYRRI